MTVNGTELAELLRSPFRTDEIGLDTPVIIVTLDSTVDAELTAGIIPVVFVGVAGDLARAGAPRCCDVVVDVDDPALPAIVDTINRNPLASTSLAVHLRGAGTFDVESGLAAESALYSMLQAGPEFAAWRATSHHRPAPEQAEPAVVVTRSDELLRIELNRPGRHNAFSRSMRDALAEALAIAVVDDAITTIDLSGRGPSFCSGGDLAEFGSFPDPGTAHRTRLSRSPAALMHQLARRLHVHLHGACIGAGIELAAFAEHVIANADASIALPEVTLGLIPGAGGTVSLPRRIGRHRTAYMALSGQPISATTALEWGLVDQLSEAGIRR